ncbi:MAG: DUF374 domain-containing protein [Desulfovibrio sp.]|nr:MAG: DUF374 domain-containing protein [Desulfovibrio sp.]
MGLKVNPVRFAPVAAFLYKIWAATMRLGMVNDHILHSTLESGETFVVALWHDELFIMPAYKRKYGFDMLTVVSQSRDGEFISRMLERLGFYTVRGSSSRGGLRAMVQARKLMREKRMFAAVTVDGPRGPRHEVKEGAVYLAAKTETRILPLRVEYSRAKRFSSWDRFQLPWPFTRCTVTLGEPYHVQETELGPEAMARESLKLKERLDGLAAT